MVARPLGISTVVAVIAILRASLLFAGQPVRATQGHGPATPADQIAGYMFDIPVPMSNYAFAKRVAYMFPKPGEESLTPAQRERLIWEALILHYESFRRGITISAAELDQWIDGVLKQEQLTFTKQQDPTAYQRWVTDRLGEDVELFENQMRYLMQIDRVKDTVRRASTVTVSDEEMQQEFLNEKNHVAGEMVTFETKEAAQAFYDTVKSPKQWEAMKAAGQPTVRPVNLMTLEAYMDLWGIPKEQMSAFHGLAIGSVGPPMPFGKQWCVYHLLEKRTADLSQFPNERQSYYEQIKAKKQYHALQQWIEDLKASAQLKVLPLADPVQ